LPWIPGGVAVSGDREVLIALTDGQVAQVVRGASGRPHLAGLLSEMTELDVVSSVVLALLEDAAYSRSALRALLVLNALPLDGGERVLTDIAGQVGVSASTTHRYMRTWTALGLVEQDPRSRRYRRARVVGAGGERATGAGGGDAG
jgi:DNA-binding MarR family transcriptional regulator